MNKAEKKFIYLILLAIIIISIILIIKIMSDRKYDPKIYEEIYSEYYETFGKDQNIEEKKEGMNIEAESNQSTTNLTKEKKDNKNTYKRTTSNSKVIASIIIPKLEIIYPVIRETTDEYLKIAPCKLDGGEPNKVGNLSIIGHNYKNKEFFSKLNTLKKGDKIILEDKSGSSLTYTIYDMFEVESDDFSCVEETRENKIDLTLITCTNNKSKRYVVKSTANT